MIRLMLVAAAESSARREGWLLTALIVLAMAILFVLLFGVLRRLFLKPMRHDPSDTTDAWSEAGRRLKVPAESEEEPSGDAETDEGPP